MPLPYPSRPSEPFPNRRHLLAALVLIVVLWAWQACYTAVQEFRTEYLGQGLKR